MCDKAPWYNRHPCHRTDISRKELAQNTVRSTREAQCGTVKPVSGIPYQLAIEATPLNSAHHGQKNGPSRYRKKPPTVGRADMQGS
jgi:hypothetical protein